MTVLALARWRQGDRDQAEQLAREALPTIQVVGDSWGAGVCLAVLAWTDAAAGRYDHAARMLGACQSIKRRDGALLAEQGSFAEHHAQCVRDVRKALGEAAYTAAFDHGSHLTLDEASTETLGAPRGGPRVPSSRAAQPARSPLTRREKQVAQLVAQGLTNKDIATRLVISQRTAESHIEHILAKLDFTTRAQIAGWIMQRGKGDAAD